MPEQVDASGTAFDAAAKYRLYLLFAGGAASVDG
jgi:hypothetical protein